MTYTPEPGTSRTLFPPKLLTEYVSYRSLDGNKPLLRCLEEGTKQNQEAKIHHTHEVEIKTTAGPASSKKRGRPQRLRLHPGPQLPCTPAPCRRPA